MVDPRAIQIHTDGSCYMHDKRQSGCAAWVVYPEHLTLEPEEIVDFGCEVSTQNRMELMACVRGLRWAIDNSGWRDVTCICVVTDSQYLAQNHQRVQYWKKAGWRGLSGEPIANEDLWDEIHKSIVSLSRVGLRVAFEWQKGKKSQMGKIVDRSAKAAAQRAGYDEDYGFRPGKVARSMVSGNQAALKFSALGQILVIRVYRKKIRHGREEQLSFHIFREDTKAYEGKFFAYATAEMSFDLHSGHGYRVRFNSDPTFPKIMEIIEPVPLPKPTRKRRKSEAAP
jgi:ribonuclease HI